MKPFAYLAPGSCEEAIGSIGQAGVFYAGGTDVVPLMQQNIIFPDTLVDIKRCSRLRGIDQRNGYLRLGALTTLAELERDPLIAHRYPVLAQAAGLAATPQLRRRATIAGNLLQRPRCWYFRHREVNCWLKGGTHCPAVAGQNQYLALVRPSSPCHAVHPSDLAPALAALNARINLCGAHGKRTLAIDQFYAEPEERRRRECRIEPDELIESIDLPPLPQGSGSVFLKAMERKVWAFALVSVAVVRTPDGWRVAVGGVAATPLLLPQLATSLQQARDSRSLLRVTESALSEARPLSMNAYKAGLLRRLLGRAVEQLGYADAPATDRSQIHAK
jgi:xanthine dehydrogenase YagS FAD-binding subunit